MKRSIVSLCMVVFCVVANTAFAQQNAKLETGVRVRVTPKQGDKIVGTVAGFDADSLRVTLDGTDYMKLDGSERYPEARSQHRTKPRARSVQERSYWTNRRSRRRSRIRGIGGWR
jgi:hypothetical protein